jgi:thioredoxin-dependent peroxiredoxin
MMVIGISRAEPSEESSTSPSARGPFSLALRASWAAPVGTRLSAINPQMTARRRLRYNHERNGDATMLDVNDKAPDIKLEDENGKEVSLKDFKGKTVVLYFYPRADTPGCTKEACEFRDTYKQMQKTGAVLLGASPDTPKAQKKFQEKFHLPFTLLADADKKLCNAFGVIQEKNMYGKKVMGVARTTFVIGPDGKIKRVFHKVKPEGHSEEVLAYLKEAA